MIEREGQCFLAPVKLIWLEFREKTSQSVQPILSLAMNKEMISTDQSQLVAPERRRQDNDPFVSGSSWHRSSNRFACSLPIIEEEDRTRWDAPTAEKEMKLPKMSNRRDSGTHKDY